MDLDDVFTLDEEFLDEDIGNVVDEDLSSRCQACLQNNNGYKMKDMTKTYCYLGNDEIYAGMLDYCFSMKLEKCNEEENENVYLICDSCIKQLRLAANFKQQVDESQKKIKQWFEKKVADNNETEEDAPQLKESDDSQLEHEDDDFVLLLVDRETHIPDALIPEEIPVIRDNHVNEESTNISTADLSPMILNEVSNDNLVSFSVDVVEDCQNNNEFEMQKPSANDNIPKIKTKRPRAKYSKYPYALEKNQLQCKICNVSFEYQRQLYIHMPEHYPNFTCELCGRVFAINDQLKKHRCENARQVKTYTCPHCPGMIFNSKVYMLEHTKKTHSDNPLMYRCPECLERFSNYEQRRKHLITVHGQVEEMLKYKCKYCEKPFISSSSRSAHMRKVHLKEYNYVCHHCGQKFFAITNFNQHLLKHIYTRNFTCSLCNRKFQRKTSLTQHMKTHADGDFICDCCGKIFTQKAYLTKHLQTHLPEVIFQEQEMMNEEI